MDTGYSQGKCLYHAGTLLKRGFSTSYRIYGTRCKSESSKTFYRYIFLMYLKQMSMFSMTASSGALMSVTRPDIVVFLSVFLSKGVELADKTRDLLLKQGTLIKPPSISTPEKVDFVKKQHFLSGFFGKKRSLTAIEITHLYLNIRQNAIGKAIMIGIRSNSPK